MLCTLVAVVCVGLEVLCSRRHCRGPAREKIVFRRRLLHAISAGPKLLVFENVSLVLRSSGQSTAALVLIDGGYAEPARKSREKSDTKFRKKKKKKVTAFLRFKHISFMIMQV